jgi:thioredoxin 2
MSPSSHLLVRCPTCGATNRVPVERVQDRATCGSCHKPLPTIFTEPVALSEESFDHFMAQQKGLVLAEFWAPW